MLLMELAHEVMPGGKVGFVRWARAEQQAKTQI